MGRQMQRMFRDEQEVRLACDGASEWAHLEDKRRFKTVGMEPEERHTTGGSLMLCKSHHVAYDRHRIKITILSRAGADGPLRFEETK
jgi:hypothetical protein